MNKVISYKGFDKDLKCRGFQFQVGETVKHEGKVKECESGFHACPAPLSTFGYYSPSESRFCVVEQSGQISEGGDKIASSVLTVKAEINLFDMVKAQVEWVKKHLKKDDEELNTGNCSAASNTGYQSAASNTGDYSAASNTGNCSAASVKGSESVAVVTGYDSKAKASEGSWVVITERNDEFEILDIKTAKAGVDIEPDTYYKLVDGQFVRCEEED